MARKRCDYLVPHWDVHLHGEDNKILECLLPKSHDDEHLVKLKNGCYFLWQPDEECGGECGEEFCECFTYHEITAAEAEGLLGRRPNTRNRPRRKP